MKIHQNSKTDNNSFLDKIKTASKIQIHLNPKDYEILKGQLNLEPFIELKVMQM